MVSNSSEEVSFDAPAALIERVESISEIRSQDLAEVLIDAIRMYLEDYSESEDFQRQVAELFYDDQLSLDGVKRLVGPVEAQRLQLLKTDLQDEPLDL